MEIRAKHIVIGLGLLTAIGYFVKTKVSNWKILLPKMKAYPTGLRNLKWQLGGGLGGTLAFDIDITIFNPTNQNFTPDGLLAILDRVEITAFEDRTTIAEIDIKQGYLDIPANGNYVLKNKRVSVPVNLSILDILRRIKSPDDLNATPIMKVLGTEYRI